MSVVACVTIAVAVFLASCMQASIGFGMGMLAAPVVALVAPTLLPGMLIASATTVTLLVVIRERGSLDFRGTGWALAGRVPGTVAGALLLVWLPTRGLSLLLAAVVLGGVVIASVGWRPAPVRRNLATAGVSPRPSLRPPDCSARPRRSAAPRWRWCTPARRTRTCVAT